MTLPLEFQDPIDACADRNERHNQDWQLSALAALRRFAAADPGRFTIEQARTVLARELPTPTDLRAWGALTQSAIRAQIIRPTRHFTAAKSSHGSPKRMYTRDVGSLLPVANHA
jgi:hypothetical protein